MVTGQRLFTFAVIADTHVTEAEAMAISGFDIDTIKLGAARSRYVVDRLNSLKLDFVVHLGDIVHPVPGSPAYEDSAAPYNWSAGRSYYHPGPLTGNRGRCVD